MERGRRACGEAEGGRCGADARGSGENVDQVFVSTSYFLGVEIEIINNYGELYRKWEKCFLWRAV
jgi:hypothetical protein